MHKAIVGDVGSEIMDSWVNTSADALRIGIIPPQGMNSAIETRDRFGSEAAAQKYARALEGTATHRREERCIRTALAGLGAGSRVLDIPSGTSRLLPLLRGMGFQVVEADSSRHMIEQGRRYAEDRGLSEGTEFRVEDALATHFADDAFDAVLCNRLFHHFREPEVRRRCLRELSRICRGPLIVSFFCNLSVDAVSFHLRNWLRRKVVTDRIPIARSAFIADVVAARLRVVRMMMARPGISRQWYAVLERAEDCTDNGSSFERPRVAE
ncbi:MAG TPA: class I SAM-dependent methyltransferase [Sedimentisphaerales bacterium]|nr:class I SAM-dependent methyltransferase [Sedimentisphaerales bacterium]HOH66728.1 class I SAM-dependent methyltransferase [Sedimentisphaerales bacterium]